MPLTASKLRNSFPACAFLARRKSAPINEEFKHSGGFIRRHASPLVKINFLLIRDKRPITWQKISNGFSIGGDDTGWPRNGWATPKIL